MEGELKNMALLFVLTASSLFCCYHISSKITKGFPRLLSIFPLIILFTILPFNLQTIHLGAAHVSLLSFLANFKLILFAFDQGPLSPLPSNPYLFIIKAGFPFKIKGKIEKCEPKQTVPSLILESARKATFLVLLYYCYNFRQYFHEHVLWIIRFFYVYHLIQFLFAVTAIPAQVLIPGVELEQQFDAPIRATSLQNFWGHRWNLRVTDLLRSTIYNPVKTISRRVVGPRWASLPAVLATFTTSGLMHELIYYQMIRENPTWEVTWFFVLQGVFVDIEIVLKKKLVDNDKFRLHEAISRPLTLANVALSAAWLSYPQLLRNGIDMKVIQEFNVLVELFNGPFV